MGWATGVLYSLSWLLGQASMRFVSLWLHLIRQLLLLMMSRVLSCNVNFDCNNLLKCNFWGGKKNWEWVLLCQEAKWVSLCEKPEFTSYRHLKILAEPSNAKDSHSPFPPLTTAACFQQYSLQSVFHATWGEGGCSVFFSNPQSTASLGTLSKLKESLISKCEVWYK